MNKQTVIITGAQPIVVSESVDEIKKKLRGAKEERSKFIYPTVYKGSEMILCVDIIMMVTKIDIELQKDANMKGVAPKSNLIVPPPPGFGKK